MIDFFEIVPVSFYEVDYLFANEESFLTTNQSFPESETARKDVPTTTQEIKTSSSDLSDVVLASSKLSEASSKLSANNSYCIGYNVQKVKVSKEIILPDILASNYANFFVFSLNQQEPTELRRFFHTICTPEARIVINVFSLSDDSLSGNNMPLNHFGNFSYADLSIEEFIYLQSTCWEVVPDGFANIFSSRSCYEGKSSVYISCYCFTGTIISKDSVIGLGDRSGSLYKLRKPCPDILLMSVLQNYCHSYKAEGSLIMYRNREGKISGLEFYYRFLF